jgi:hypothetical protein
MYTFDSDLFVHATLPDFPVETIKNEPMFFSSSYDYVRQFGGPISHAFLDNIYSKWKEAQDLIIDSRVHMLMPGWWPAIPGFHMDDVPRSRSDAQPNYENPEYKATHCMALVGDCCPTEFALGTSEFPEVPLGEKIYKVWHPIVIQQIKEGKLTSVIAPSNKMLYFDWQTWHQGTCAVKNGWRWFMRATINTHRKHKNEIRRQVQVYLENPMEGW